MNRKHLAFLSANIAAPAAPPTEFRIWGYGPVDTIKGQFVFDRPAADAVMAAYRDHGAELSFDYEHQAISGEGAAPAAAWFNLDLRDDGLYATNVRWTDRARGYLEAKEYRYFSPAFLHDQNSKRVTKLVNMALTNIPATKDMAPLVAASATLDRPQEVTPMKTLLKALGLPEDATEAEALAALNALQAANSGMITLSGKATPAEAQGVFAAWKASSEQVVTLTARVTQLEGEQARGEVARLVSQGKAAGKITPALEAVCLSWDKAQLTSFLEHAPVVLPAGEHTPPDQGAGGTPVVVTLSATEKEAARQTGVSEEDYAKYKAAKAAQAQA